MDAMGIITPLYPKYFISYIQQTTRLNWSQTPNRGIFTPLHAGYKRYKRYRLPEGSIVGKSVAHPQSTPLKTNMDTQNDGVEKVAPALNMAIFGIYVKFLWGVPDLLKKSYAPEV